MDDQTKKVSSTLSFLLLLLILLPALICGLYIWFTQTIQPLFDLSRDISIPFSISSTKKADYSPDSFPPIGNVGLGIILDLLQDLDPASVPENRMATLIVSLQTPVASVTPPPGSTPPGATAPATLVGTTPQVGTPVAGTAITASPLVLIPNTPIPSTSTSVPPPLPKPTKTPFEEPPTVIPTATYTITPEPAHLAFINPAGDGTLITSNIQTMFEAEAWDPAVGTNNGDGVTSVTFTIYDSVGNTIYTSTDSSASYCSFGGGGSCNDAASAGVILGSDTYTLMATMLTAAGETRTITRTFAIPVQIHLEIILPPSDGTIIANTGDTKFEAEAWDSEVGITNGAGITSVTFTLYDSLGNTVHTYGDAIPLYCVFGGDSACNPSPVAGVLLGPDTYILEAIVFTDAGGSLTVTRTFTVP